MKPLNLFQRDFRSIFRQVFALYGTEIRYDLKAMICCSVLQFDRDAAFPNVPLAYSLCSFSSLYAGSGGEVISSWLRGSNPVRTLDDAVEH